MTLRTDAWSVSGGQFVTERSSSLLNCRLRYPIYPIGFSTP